MEERGKEEKKGRERVQKRRNGKEESKDKESEIVSLEKSTSQFAWRLCWCLLLQSCSFRRWWSSMIRETAIKKLSWRQPKGPLTDEWMKIWYNGMLFSRKKERYWVICSDVDEPRDCHTEWSKSEREKQVSYTNTYMWNLEKWYGWTYLQGRNRDAEVENGWVDMEGGEVAGTNWETEMEVRAPPCVK